MYAFIGIMLNLNLYKNHDYDQTLYTGLLKTSHNSISLPSEPVGYSFLLVPPWGLASTLPDVSNFEGSSWGSWPWVHFSPQRIV